MGKKNKKSSSARDVDDANRKKLKEQEKHKEIKSEEENDDTQEKEDEDMVTCGFDCEEAEGNNDYTIFVKGFENLRHRSEIKKMLSSVFGKCGKIARVFVPIEYLLSLILNLKLGKTPLRRQKEIVEKALEFNGRSLEGRQLLVTMASKRGEYYGYTNFHGCERCCNKLPLDGGFDGQYGVSLQIEDSSYDGSP